MGYDATAKAVIVARERGAASEGARGIIRAFSLSTAGEFRLGAALWDLKYEHRKAGAFNAAALLLTRAFDGHAKQGTILRAICEAALTEFLADQCPKCKGRGRTGAGREIIETKRATCRACRGAGRLFSTSSRWAHYAEAGALVGDEIPRPVTIERPCEPCAGKGWGSGSVKKNSRLRACIACRGSGKKLWRDKERALAIGLNGQQFELWKPTYLLVLRQIRIMDMGTAYRVDIKLSRVENHAYTEGDALPTALRVAAEHPADEGEPGEIPGTIGRARPEETQAPP